MASEQWGEFWKFLGQAITIVVGWAVVHRLTVRRDIDKARRETVAKSADSLADSVDRTLGAAIKYHTSPRSVTDELQLKTGLQDLSNRILALGAISCDEAELARCRSLSKRLWRNVTRQHFEDEHIAPCSIDAPQLQEIAADALELKLALTRLKHRQFEIV